MTGGGYGCDESFRSAPPILLTGAASMTSLSLVAFTVGRDHAGTIKSCEAGALVLSHAWRLPQWCSIPEEMVGWQGRGRPRKSSD